MKSRTSFFNLTVLKKDITRFAPVWGLYTVFTLLYVLGLWDDGFYSAAETFMVMGAVNLVYGGLCALVLFGDLFNPRHCNALHAMPMRREGWFFTHLTAGALFCVVPNLLGALVAFVVMENSAYLAFLWLLVAVLSYLFFFGVGAFSALCAGNRLGAAAVYALVNFLAVLIAWLVDTFYAPALPGVVLDLAWLSWLCPVLRISQTEFVDVYIDKYRGLVVKEIYWEGFGYAAIVAAAGIGFMALALLVYRKRKLESAGDLIALKPVSPVFLVLYTLCVGAILYLIAELFGTNAEYVFLVVGLIVGFFTGWMLLEKRVRVFRKKRFFQLAILLVCFFGTIGITWLDPIGVTRYVPEKEQVKSVSISPYSADGGVSSLATDKYVYQRGVIKLTDPEDVETILGVHGSCIENRFGFQKDGGASILTSYTYIVSAATPLHIRYELTNGAVVKRCYMVPKGSEASKALKPYYSSPEYVLGTENVGDLLSRVIQLDYSDHYYKENRVLRFQPGSANNARIEDVGSSYAPGTVSYHVVGDLTNSPEAVMLFQALLADCEAGTMAQLFDYHGDVAGSLAIQYRDEKGVMQYLDITVYTDSANTVAQLNSLLNQ